jgi:hypothetical protein
MGGYVMSTDRLTKIADQIETEDRAAADFARRYPDGSMTLVDDAGISCWPAQSDLTGMKLDRGTARWPFYATNAAGIAAWERDSIAYHAQSAEEEAAHKLDVEKSMAASAAAARRGESSSKNDSLKESKSKPDGVRVTRISR